jgi:hypothetical protein
LFISPAEGEESTIGWFFDLDEPSPVAHVLEEFDERGGPYFAGKVLTVQPGTPVNIDVKAKTVSRECSWVIKLDVVDGGRQGTLSIDNDGKPFRTSAGQSSAPVYTWAYYNCAMEVSDSGEDVGYKDPPWDHIYQPVDGKWTEQEVLTNIPDGSDWEPRPGTPCSF